MRLRHLVAVAGLLLVPAVASATTQSVTYNTLNATSIVGAPLFGGDTLAIDTLVTNDVGALLQTTTFTVGANVTSVTGNAVWQVTTAAGLGPRLTGVNIDVFDATNTLVFSDTFVGALGGFAISSLDSPLAPGVYKLVATGTGVRDSVLDISLSFVPEPTSAGVIFGSLASVACFARPRRRA